MASTLFVRGGSLEPTPLPATATITTDHGVSFTYFPSKASVDHTTRYLSPPDIDLSILDLAAEKDDWLCSTPSPKKNDGLQLPAYRHKKHGFETAVPSTPWEPSPVFNDRLAGPHAEHAAAYYDLQARSGQQQPSDDQTDDDGVRLDPSRFFRPTKEVAKYLKDYQERFDGLAERDGREVSSSIFNKPDAPIGAFFRPEVDWWQVKAVKTEVKQFKVSLPHLLTHLCGRMFFCTCDPTFCFSRNTR